MGAGVERFPDDVGGITDDGVGAFVMRERTDGKAERSTGHSLLGKAQYSGRKTCVFLSLSAVVTP